ncbi:MAG TPA: class II fructose-bisphosphate aldolase [Candidatus Paceibacterota bacterium]|nr:class II fructose-bisphosphate aldolase [Candidatus Paceibacterota bacterium]
MKTLGDYFKDAKKQGWAIGHFNFATADVLRAVVAGAKEGGAPCVMVGTSPGESKFLGMHQAAALVNAVRKETGFPVFLNADHFKTVKDCRAAVDAGYDTVLFDGGGLVFEQNVSETRDVWNYAKTKGGIMVEAELGYLKGSSQVQKSVTIGPDDYTNPDEAESFVKRTGVERLAVVFGNIHGIVTEQQERLDIPHLKDIAASVPGAYLVLHGASGLPDAQVRDAILAGITNVHFNTELRVAYATSLREQLQNHPDETTPYKFLEPAVKAVQEVVRAKTRVFMGN